TEGGLAQVPCLDEDESSCDRMGSCRTVEMWRGLDKVINDYLDGITVADLAERIDEGNYYVI
ncbi:MAG: Rrf2 family transcriptional regulator, partial [Slackia sp.]|nr:Rrf2 family transcriptional regulator [Slackia sp.]